MFRAMPYEADRGLELRDGSDCIRENDFSGGAFYAAIIIAGFKDMIDPVGSMLDLFTVGLFSVAMSLASSLALFLILMGNGAIIKRFILWIIITLFAESIPFLNSRPLVTTMVIWIKWECDKNKSEHEDELKLLNKKLKKLS